MWAMRRCSGKDDVSVIRCCFTKGRCWQCPNPARTNRAYCRLHRTSDNDFKIKDFLSSSDPSNSNRESSSDPKDSSSNDNSKKRKRESKKKKKEEEQGGENDAPQQQVSEAKTEAKTEAKAEAKAESKAEVIREVLPNGVITVSSPLPKPTNVSPYLTKTTKDGKEVRVVIGDQRKFRCKNANVSGFFTEQLDIREEISLHQVKKSNPIAETRKSETQHLLLLDNCNSDPMTVDEISCEKNEHMEAAVTDSEVNGAVVHEKSAEVENSYYCLYQLFPPPLKHLNLDQIFELEIDANSQGNLIAGVYIPVIECADDAVFNCNHCQIRIENLHRSCMKCNFKLCVECCQTFRLQSSKGGVHKTVNSRKLEMLKAVEIHDKKITCPVTLGGCAEDYLKVKCLVPLGWKPVCGQKQDRPV